MLACKFYNYIISNFLVGLIVLLIMFTLSYGFKKVTVLLSLLGATSQIYLIFIIPILLYIKAFDLQGYKKNLYLAVVYLVVLLGTAYLLKFILHQFFNILI